MVTAGRNDPCPCGSGKKYKKCCMHKPQRGVSSLLQFSSFTRHKKLILFILIGLLIIAGLAAYFSSFQGDFVFDDKGRIKGNTDIQSFTFPWKFLGKTRRPFLYLTLAGNYALGGYNVFGYHLVNFFIHICAALALFGIVRRSCSFLSERAWDRNNGLFFAFVVSLIWLVHPVQTQSVTYIIQRAESMMGMFYLLTLYLSIRFMASRKAKWMLLATGSCLLGGLTKEIMITAPVVVLLYDRAFVSSSFKEALIKQKSLYLALFCTPLLMLLNLFIIPPEKDPSQGFVMEGFFSLERFLQQPLAILHYLKMTFWPYPLILDYGWPAMQPFGILIPAGIFVLGLMGLSLWAYRKHPAVGFLGLSFFVILSVTSTFIPLNMIFDHRMYLPLACVVILSVLALMKILMFLIPEKEIRNLVAFLLVVFVAGSFGFLTFKRNQDFHSERNLWKKNVKMVPDNPRALNNYGLALIGANEDNLAETYLKRALELKPDYFEAHNNLGLVLLRQNKSEESMRHCEEAIKLKPDYVEAYCNFGLIYVKLGNLDKAIEKYKQALRINAGYAPALNNLGVALENQKKYEEALGYYKRAIKVDPDYAQAFNNVGVIFFKWGRWAEAKEYFEKAIEKDPHYQKAKKNLSYALKELKKQQQYKSEKK